MNLNKSLGGNVSSSSNSSSNNNSNYYYSTCDLWDDSEALDSVSGLVLQSDHHPMNAEQIMLALRQVGLFPFFPFFSLFPL
jgi:hypothetical protein